MFLNLGFELYNNAYFCHNQDAIGVQRSKLRMW